MKMISILLFMSILHLKSLSAYKTSIVNISNCADPEPPYAPYSPFELNVEVYYNKELGKKLIRGNLTAKEDIPNGSKEGTFRFGLAKADGKKRLDKIKWQYQMNHLKCRGFVAKAILNNFHIPFVKTCSLKKGFYPISDVDVYLIDRAFRGIAVRIYGLYVAETVIYDGKFTLGCWTGYVYIGPDKVKPVKEKK